ncbi:predicted protein [Postia placenta Mad-698-R]|nr:predicted protein [Postia placenta Mad-698-R]
MSTAADNGVNDTTRKNLILNYCFIALSGLVLYEYIITISDEIQLFWDRRPTTWSFFLFTSNRLIMIGLVVTGALTVAPADRVTSSQLVPEYGYVRNWVGPTGNQYLTIASRTSAMVSDIIVIVVTWYYTYNRYRYPLQLQDQPSLTLLMLRDDYSSPTDLHDSEGSSTDLQDLSFIDASTRLHQQLELGDDESVTLAGTIELDDVVDRDQLDLKSGSVFGKSDSPVGTGDNFAKDTPQRCMAGVLNTSLREISGQLISEVVHNLTPVFEAHRDTYVAMALHACSYFTAGSKFHQSLEMARASLANFFPKYQEWNEAAKLHVWVSQDADAILLYEYIITIWREVTLVWNRRHGSACFILFQLNRLVMLGLIITGALIVVPASQLMSCKAVVFPYSILIQATYALWAGLSAIRVFALSSRHLILTAVTLITGLIPFGINIYPMSPNMDVCEFEYNYYVPPQFSTVARASSMISDAIVIIVTWYYTYTRHRNVFRLDCQASLAALLIQDGTLYFVIFLIMNIARIIVVCTHIIDIVPEFMVTILTLVCASSLSTVLIQAPLIYGSCPFPPTQVANVGRRLAVSLHLNLGLRGYLGGMDEDMNLEHGNNGDALEIEEELRFCETQSDMSRLIYPPARTSGTPHPDLLGAIHITFTFIERVMSALKRIAHKKPDTCPPRMNDPALAMPTPTQDQIIETARKNAALQYCYVAMSGPNVTAWPDVGVRGRTGHLSYEYFITIGSEINMIWCHRRTTPSFCLFLINRVNMLGLIVTGVFITMPASKLTSCEAAVLPYNVFHVATYATWAGLSTLRVFALSGRNVLLTGITLITALFTLSINILAECYRLPVCTASGLSSMISDTIVVVITWYYTYAQYRNTHMLKMQASLTGMLLRDDHQYNPGVHDVVSTIENPPYGVGDDGLDGGRISTVLVSRYFLDLREVAYDSTLADPWSGSGLYSLPFLRPPFGGRERCAQREPAMYVADATAGISEGHGGTNTPDGVREGTNDEMV